MKIERYAVEFERERENDDFENSRREEDTKSNLAK
jgi:hypothetical protein